MLPTVIWIVLSKLKSILPKAIQRDKLAGLTVVISKAE